MAGSFQLARSRMDVVSSTGDEWKGRTVTVRDGVAQVTKGRTVEAEMEVADWRLVGRRNHYEITGTNGHVWDVTRKGCGCGNR